MFNVTSTNGLLPFITSKYSAAYIIDLSFTNVHDNTTSRLVMSLSSEASKHCGEGGTHCFSANKSIDQPTLCISVCSYGVISYAVVIHLVMQ